MLLAYGLTSAAYLLHTWSPELASWEGDEMLYTLTAEYFSPWLDHSPAAVYAATNAKFPPLFPLVLAFTGGGGSVLAANIATTVLLLLSFVVLFLWLKAEGLGEGKAFALAFVFAILPGTYMQALFVASEGLYLILSLGCLIAVTKSERSSDNHWLMTAVICVAAATLTRSAGWSLFVAFATYLAWRKHSRTWQLSMMAALPGAAWAIYKTTRSSIDEPGYFGILAEWYTANPVWNSTNPVAVLLNQVLWEAPRFWKGLVADFTTSSIGVWVFGFISLLFIAAVAYRLFLRKFDGIYVTIYLAMILVWPFGYAYTGEKRFAFAILPILMCQTWFLIERLSQTFLRHPRFNPVAVVYLSVIVLLALPSLALAVARHFEPIEPDMEPFRRAGWWYGWYADGNMITRPQDRNYAKALSQGLRTLSALIPQDECLYSPKSVSVSFYTKRISKLPPPERLDETEFRKALHENRCRYFFFTNDISPSISAQRFYPMERLGDNVQQIAAIHYVDSNDKMIVGILGKLN